jgi:hexosaminidase
LEITITFDRPTKINKIKTRFYNANGQWLYAPKEIMLTGNLQLGGAIVSDKQSIEYSENDILVTKVFDYSDHHKLIVESIILKIPSYGIIPDGLQGAGNKAWTFIDEIVIE